MKPWMKMKKMMIKLEKEIFQWILLILKNVKNTLEEMENLIGAT